MNQLAFGFLSTGVAWVPLCTSGTRAAVVSVEEPLQIHTDERHIPLH
jgi:hypothetical protein